MNHVLFWQSMIKNGTKIDPQGSLFKAIHKVCVCVRARARVRACVCVRACVRDFLWLVSLCLCAFDYFFFGRPVSVSVLLSLRPSLSVPFSLRPPSLTLSLSLFPHFLSLARSLPPSLCDLYVCICLCLCVCVCV